MRLNEFNIQNHLTFDTFRQLIRDTSFYILTAYLDNKKVAELTYYIENDNELFMDYVKVYEKYRRMGIASSMYNYLSDEYPGYTFTNAGRTPDGEAFRKSYDQRIKGFDSKPTKVDYAII